MQLLRFCNWKEGDVTCFSSAQALTAVVAFMTPAEKGAALVPVGERAAEGAAE